MDIPSENVANVDASWLRMDEPGNLMIVNGVMMLDERISFERFRELIGARLVDTVHRLRQRIVHSRVPLAGPRWESDPHFDLSYHVRLAPLERADRASLQDLVGRLMSEPLDPDRPLWTNYFVPDCEGGCATIARFHHCIGDGLALLYLLLKIADDAAPGPPAGGEAAERTWWDLVMRPLARGLSLTRQVEESVVREARALLSDPARALDAARDLSNDAGALGKLLLMRADPPTIFKGPLSARKRAVWSQPVPIPTIKAIAAVTGSTINDVVLAAVAGALRQYLLSRAQPVEDLNVRAVVPVNLRPMEEASQLGNGFGLAFVPLPLGIEEPLDRVFEMRKRMREVKDSPEPLLTFQVLRMLGLTPSPLFEMVVSLFGTRATAVMTNVIGPRQPLRVGGATLKQMMFWVPSSGQVGMGVSIFSYAGGLSVGIATDAGLVPDPHRIVDFFDGEMSALVNLAWEVRPEIARRAEGVEGA